MRPTPLPAAMIAKVIRTLLKKGLAHSWYAWSVDSHMTGKRLVYKAFIDAQIVIIRYFDLTEGSYPNPKFFWGRDLDRKTQRIWLELEVIDEAARTGHKVLVPQTIIPPGDPNFTAMNKLRDMIHAKAQIWHPHEDKKLTKSQAIAHFCRSI